MKYMFDGIFIVFIMGFPLAVTSYVNNKGSCQVKKIWIALTMALIAGRLIPVVRTDLFRYNQKMMELAELSYRDLLQQTKLNDMLIHQMFWAFGKLGWHSLLPAVSAFALYSVMLEIFGGVLKQVKASRYLKFVLLMFTMSIVSFYYSTEIIRNMLAFSISMYAVFRDLFQKKRNVYTIILYILPCMIHISSFVFIILRISVWLFYSAYPLFLAGIFISPFMLYEAYHATKNLTFSNRLLELFRQCIDSAYWYYYEFDYGWALAVKNSGFMNVQRFFFFVLLAAILFEIFIYHRRFVKENPEHAKLLLFLEGFGALTFVTFHIMDAIYLRLYYIWFLILPAILFPVIRMASEKRFFRYYNGILLFAYIPIGIVFQIYRMYGYVVIKL